MLDKTFEKSLIRNCAATLAGIKIGNLFNYSFSSIDDCRKTLEEVNGALNAKGVFVELLSHQDKFYLIYAYRLSALRASLKNNEIKSFLEHMGYTLYMEAAADIEGNQHIDVLSVLNTLKSHIGNGHDFPHEIGVFLGYPLEDIIGFISNKGKNYLYCGLWKVYRNKVEAIKYFSKITKCHSIYINIYERGVSIPDMTVCA